jgi:hypothetical protein
MGVITGLKVTINGFPCIADFTVANIGFDNGIACSDSNGKVIRSATEKDWRGVVHGYGATAPAMPGADLNFAAYGVGGGGIVDKIEVVCDTKNPKAIIRWTLWASANNASTAVAGGSTGTGTATSPPSTKGMGVGNGGGDWKLTAVCHNAGPIWHSGQEWPERSIGNTDATAEWEWYYGAGAIIRPTAGAAAAVTLPYGTGNHIVTGICMKSDVRVVVHNAQNEPEYTVASGAIMGTLT